MTNKKPAGEFPQAGFDDEHGSRHYKPKPLKYKSRQAKSQPSNGAVGNDFYRKMFGGKDGVK